jgi:nucleotide-binding universal stress UspA family protein
VYQVRRILVPVDFSRHTGDAVEHAVVFGEHFEAEITLLHVEESVVCPPGTTEEGDPAVVAYRERARAFAEEQFAHLAAAVEGRKVTLKTKFLAGRAYKAVVEEAEKREYDLIVLPTRGHTHLAQVLIGGTSERVVRFSRRPVLSIQSAPRDRGRVRSVLCPTDFSPAGNVGLSYALSIARQNEAVLYLQYVSELDQPETREAVMARVPPLADHHPLAAEVKVEYVFDRDVEPSNSIVRFAEDRDVGIIVMSAHGRKGLRRVYIGNNTAEVVRQANRPVLTVTHPFHRTVFSHPVTQDGRRLFDTTPAH